MANAIAHDVQLLLKSTGRVLTNWDRYTVSLDMFNVGQPWTFSLWYSEREQSAWQTLQDEVKLGGKILFSIDGAPQLTGIIEELSTPESRNGFSMVISGRDIAASALDWDADPRTVVSNRPLGDVLELLFSQLGIAVDVVESSAAREVQSRARRGARATERSTRRRAHRVDSSRPRPDETVWQVVQSLLDRLGLMAWVAPSAQGGLAIVVDVPAYDSPPLYQLERSARLTETDRRLLETDLKCSIRGIPTVVYASGRAKRGDAPPARHRVQYDVPGMANVPPGVIRAPTSGVANLSIDVLGASIGPSLTSAGNPIAFNQEPTIVRPGVRIISERHEAPPAQATRRAYTNDQLAAWSFVQNPLPPQPKYLHSSRAKNPSQGEREARRFMAKKMRNFRIYMGTLRGHGQEVNGTRRLFALNTMAHLRDTFRNIDEDMLITGCEFSGSRADGQRTRLTLGTKGAINLEPDPQ